MYDPQAIIGTDGTNFFKEYLAQVTGGAAYDDPSHPDVTQRAARVQSKLAAVADEVVLFQIGVQYFVYGEVGKAESYFNRFLEKFPSREVFNNIGLVHYQLAVEKLSSCDRFLPSRFLLPVFLDSRTIAEPRTDDVHRGNPECQHSESFKHEITEAVQWFEKAKERDPFYLPAHINLTSAYIMAGNGVKAKNAARDTLQIHPASEYAVMLEAISSYLDGIADNNNLAAQQALKKLDSLLKSSKALSHAVLYNLGMIRFENSDQEEARKHFSVFLEKQTSGIHSNRARLLLNAKPVGATQSKLAASLKLPISLGTVSAATRKLLDKMRRKDDAGEYRTEIYQSSDTIAVVSGESLQLIIVKQKEGLTSEAFIKKHGPPEREIQTPTGFILVFNGFAIEIMGDAVRSISHYRGE